MTVRRSCANLLFLAACVLAAGALLMCTWLHRRAPIPTVVRLPAGLTPPYIIGAQYVNQDIDPQDAEFLMQITEGAKKISQDDERLVNLIRKYYIIPPSSEKQNMKTTMYDTSMGQAAAINEILDNKKNGFFVECGALDGETRSNTYFFESTLNWRGILIEADPSNFLMLTRKHRKAFTINACLSPYRNPIEVVFKQHFNIGRISINDTNDSREENRVKILCFPFYSVMLALNRTSVDYFSLDIEGEELDVLKTIPFSKVRIKTLSVEYVHVKGGENAVLEYMVDQGFEIKGKVIDSKGYANDIIFVNEDNESNF